MATLTDLLNPGTYEQTRDLLIAELTARGFPADSWQSGSVPRTLLEAAATLLHSLSVRISEVAKGGFLDTAIGAWLDLLAKGFYDLTRQPAVFARGTVDLVNGTVTSHNIGARTLWAGTADGKRFTNRTAFTLGGNDVVDTEWEAESPGASFNVGVNTITILHTPIAGVTVSNPGNTGVWLTQAGKDAELDADLRKRCRSRWPELSATRTPVGEVWETLCKAGSAEVTRVAIAENSPYNGHITIRLAGAGGGVSPTAVAAVSAYLAPLRPLCSTLNIASAATETVNITGSVTVRGATIAQATADVNAKLLAYQQTLGIGDTVRTNQIIHEILDAAGVERVVLLGPLSDVVPPAGSVPVLTSGLTYVLGLSRMSYLEWAKGLVPPFLSGALGRGWYEVHGKLVEYGAIKVRDAVKARFPAHATGDALDAIGDDRLMSRAPSESDAAYAAVLEDAHTEWAKAGSKAGLEVALRRLGFPNAVVMEAIDWTGDPIGTDAAVGNGWGRFWVIIPSSDHSWVSDGNWNSGGNWETETNATWDSSATVQEVEAVRREIRRWKPSHLHLEKIIVLLSAGDHSWPSADWSSAAVWAGDAAYWNLLCLTPTLESAPTTAPSPRPLGAMRAMPQASPMRSSSLRIGQLT